MEIVGIVVGILVILAMLFCVLMARFAVRPRVTPLEKTKEYLINMPIMKGEDVTLHNEHTIKSFDGYELYVGFIPGNPESKKYMVLSHGYTSSRYGMYKYAMLYRRMGFNCVVYDQRGHGANKPTVTSFGYKEARDLMAVIADTYERYGDDIKLGLHGESMGSGTQIEALKYHPKIEFIVNGCGYSEILSVLKWKCKRDFHLPGALAEGASVFCKLMYGFSFKEVRPIDNLKDNKIPICFIHGGADDFVHNWHSQKMYEATQGYKEIHIFEGAGHAQCIDVDVERYERILREFMEKVYESV